MNGVRKRTLFLLMLAILLFIMLVPVIGCTSGTNGYKQLRVDKGIAHFYLEYPHEWKVRVVEIEQDYTEVEIDAPSLVRDYARIRSTDWYLFITTTEDKWPNAKAALEDDLSFRKERFNNFKLLDRSSIELSGVTGEQVIYFYKTAIQGPPDEPAGGLEPTIARDMYFDYGGLVWNIAVISNQEVADTHKIHFEHMLETFQFLE